MSRPKNDALREFLLKNLADHAGDIATFAAESLGITRASVNGYLRALVEEGLVEASGQTKGRNYTLKRLDTLRTTIDLGTEQQEDVIWRDTVYSHFSMLPQNVMRICEYAFGEIMNNAIDHSEGARVTISVERNYARVVFSLTDDGVGIFDKITKECGLTNKHEAILELSKGKLTTDRSKHTGEGIFFTSRMVDDFMIISGGLEYSRRRRTNGEYISDVEPSSPQQKGTTVQMEIATNATQTIKDVFDQYLGDEYRFSKTTIPLKLASYEGEHLVSRSQARRIMTRVERFTEVWLDFSEITQIGQQFADEIFRVWARAHPQVRLSPYNFSEDVERMIRHARANATEDGSAEQPSSASERGQKP